MAFSWTYPDPLDPNKPSLIGGKLRNVIGSFAVYISEIFDAINTIRAAIGQSQLTWSIKPVPGEIDNPNNLFVFNHYIHLRTWINNLLGSFGYSSVKDILGRDWSDYQAEVDGKYYAKWAIIQDFRDVLDYLHFSLEQWLVTKDYFPFPELYIEQNDLGILVKKEIVGDLGSWNITYNQAKRDFFEELGYTDYALGSVGFIPNGIESLVTIANTGYATKHPSYYAYYINQPGFTLQNILSSGITINSNMKFKINFNATYTDIIVNSVNFGKPDIWFNLGFYPNNESNLHTIIILFSDRTTGAYSNIPYGSYEIRDGHIPNQNAVYRLPHYAVFNDEIDIYPILQKILTLNGYPGGTTFDLKTITIFQMNFPVYYYTSISPPPEDYSDTPSYSLSLNKVGLVKA